MKELVAQAGSRAPLQGQSYTDFWVDADQARGEPLAQLMSVFFEDNLSTHQSVLFAGHRGSGKSTELHRLSISLKDHFLVIPVTVAAYLDVNNLEYVDLLILLYEQIYQAATAEDPEFGALVPLDNALLSRAQSFLSEVIKTTQTARNIDFGLEAGAKGTLGLLFGSLRSSFKYGTEEKTIIRQRLEPNISNLLSQCNELIELVESSLKESGYQQRRLLLVVEDLDKLGPREAKKIFYDNAHLLAQLRVDVIYTIPNALLYGPETHRLRQAFTEIFLLPTIKPLDRAGGAYQPGIQCLETILHKRFSPPLFEEGVLRTLILNCGGLIRDMLAVISRAGLYARVENSEQISTDHLDRALLQLRQEYERKIAANEAEAISTDDLRRRLQTFLDHPQQVPANDRILLDLLLSSLVIEYNNGERWLALHPLVKQHLLDLDKGATPPSKG